MVYYFGNRLLYNYSSDAQKVTLPKVQRYTSSTGRRGCGPTYLHCSRVLSPGALSHEQLHLCRCPELPRRLVADNVPHGSTASTRWRSALAP